MRRALLLYNPVSGRRRHQRLLPRVVQALEAGGLATEARPTPGPGGATAEARQAAAAGSADVVIAYGGDGTVREVAHGLLGSPVALGVLPGGTTNVVSIAFGLGTDPLAAARRLGSLAAAPIDVGACGAHPFLMQASSGVEAYLMARLDSRLKARLGFGGPFLQAFGAFVRYSYPPIEFEADGRADAATGVMVCNISEVAGPYRMAPQGRFDDGRLELMVFRGRSRAAVAAFTADLFRGVHARRRDVEIRPVETLRLLGPAGSPVQIDGDAVRDPHPLEIRMADLKLLALVAPERLSR
jgi:diacylglycerol kinase family enzyme